MVWNSGYKMIEEYLVIIYVRLFVCKVSIYSFSPQCKMSCTSKRGRFARFSASCKEDGQVKPFSGKRLQNAWNLMSPRSFLQSYRDIITSYKRNCRPGTCQVLFALRAFQNDNTFILINLYIPGCQDVTRLLHEKKSAVLVFLLELEEQVSLVSPENPCDVVHDSLREMPRSRKVDAPKGPTLKLYELHEIP